MTPPWPKTWPDAVEAFKAYLAADGLKSSTIDGYVLHLEACATAVGGDPWRVRTGQLTEWLDGRNWSDRTRQLAVNSLRRFYAFGVARQWCGWSPAAGIQVRERLRRGPQRNTIPLAWREPVTDYLTWMQAASRQPGTIRMRRAWLVRLAECAADPWSVTGDQLALWMSRDALAAETLRSMRSTLKSFYGWAVTTGRTSADPTTSLDPIRVRRTLPKPIPDDTLMVAIHHADDRTRIAIMLGALAGLRRGEIAAVHLGRDILPGVLVVRDGKGGNDRAVPLHPDLASEIAAERERRLNGGHGSGFSGRWTPERAPQADGWLFPSDVSDQHVSAGHIGVVIERALPGDWSTHSLRHRFATVCYRAERDLLAVQHLLGHSKPETTARYAAFSREAQQRAVANCGILR